MQTLMDTVRRLYGVFKATEAFVHREYPSIPVSLPEQITFMTTQELEDHYPALSPKEREDIVCKQYGAVFLMQIGGELESGIKHDGRSPDYDDWKLNGDILFYSPLFDRAFEMSSMGIRVDEEALARQLTLAGCEERKELPFHQQLLKAQLPYSIGGVQCSYWPAEMREKLQKQNVHLL